MNIKSIIVCASALTFAFCGCDSGSTNGGAPSNGIATSPRTVSGSLVSVGFEKAQLDKVLGEKKADFYTNFQKELPEDFKESLTKAGLDDIEIKWASVSVGSIEFDEDGAPKDEVPAIIAAIAFDHDADKIFATLKEEAAKSGKPATKDATFLGEKGLVLSDDKLTISLASIGGKILAIGTTEVGAETAVGVYRDGKNGLDIDMAGGTILRACINAIGERIVQKMPAEMFEGALGPDTDSATIFKGLKDGFAAISATGDNGVSISVKFDTASADDAAKIVAFANESIAGIKAMMTMVAAQDPDSKPLVDALNSLNVTASDATASANLTVSGDNFGKLVEKGLE